MPDEVRNDGRQHQRQNQRVVVRHLEDKQNAGDGRVRRRRDKSAHPNDRIRFRTDGRVRHDVGERNTERATRRGTDIERWREQATRPARVQRDRCGDDRSEREEAERVPRHSTEDLEMNREVAIAHEKTVRHDNEQPDQRATNPRNCPSWQRDASYQRFNAEEHSYEERGRGTRDYTEQWEEQKYFARET